MFCSVAISWQLNAAPYLRGVHEPFPQPREETVPVDESCWSTRAQFHACTSLIPKPTTVVFGLGTRLDVRMRTRLKMASFACRNGQQPGSAGNSFFDYSEFEAMKSLSGWVTARCDEHQFLAKIKVGP